jgi:hypothetical protein
MNVPVFEGPLKDIDEGIVNHAYVNGGSAFASENVSVRLSSSAKSVVMRYGNVRTWCREPIVVQTVRTVRTDRYST